MKKFTYHKSKLALFCLLTLTVFFNACQHEDITESTDRNSDATTTGLTQSGNCYDNCIIPGGPYFPTEDTQTVGPTNNRRTVNIKYYNTETHFFVEVKNTKQWNNLQIYNEVTGQWNNVLSGSFAANDDSNTNPILYSYLLPSGWQPCGSISFKLRVVGGGPMAEFNVNYSLIGICPDGCETSFTGLAGAGSCDSTREATYTFTADADQEYIKIQGGLTNFTGEDAVIAFLDEEGNEIEDLDNLVVSQRTPGGSSNRVITVEGSVSECETITIRIRWTSSNSGGEITGQWSVKNADGLELASPVAGLLCN